MNRLYSSQPVLFTSRSFSTSLGSRFSTIFTPESKVDVYWIPHAAAITKPNALALLPQLTDSNPLGFKSEKPARACSLLADAKKWKAEHPTKIVLVRVGEFFEAFGLDAALLVQHAGLNPMAGRPRAGCPRQNLTAVVSALTEAGLSVAVYEEASEVAKTKLVKSRKSRFLAHVVTPGMPGFVQESDILRNEAIAYVPARPFAYLTHNSLGYTLYLVHADAKECRIHRHLTEEACLTLLETSGGLAEPLFFSTLTQRLTHSVLPARRVKISVSSAASSAEIMEILCHRISQELSLANPLSNLRVLQDVDSATAGLKPLYRSAAQALGLAQTGQSTPSLAKELLPAHAPPFALRFVHKWLLCPPSARLRVAMAALVRGFCELSTAIPDFRPVGVEKTVRLLEERKANANFFLDIKQCCSGALAMLTAPLPMVEALINIASIQSGVHHLDVSSFNTQLTAATNMIDQVIRTDSAEATAADTLIPTVFFEANEVALDCVHLDLRKLAETRRSLLSVAAEDKTIAVLHYDSINNLVYSKKKTAVNAVDRKGEKMTGKYTTTKLQAAQIAYLHEAECLTAEAKKKLKELAVGISEFLPVVILASHCCVVASVASLHAEVKLRRDWTFPTISAASGRISLDGLSPYWLDPPPRGAASTSDVLLDSAQGPVLLTAPNMSGKSTFLRSLAAAVVLGSCGFSVPARSADMPVFANLIFVSPAGDRPVDGVSAFAAEVEAMAVAIRDSAASTVRSLVLVDEFGRGTSSVDGTALTTALLEFFGERRSQIACIFASHLHEVFLAKQLIASTDLVLCQMHGHSLVPGMCTDSRGIETARNFGLSDALCRRARAIKVALHGAAADELSEADVEAESASASAASLLETTVLKSLATVLPEASMRTISIRPEEKLPPLAQASAVVYVLLLADGGVYVGETDNFARRLLQHRRSKTSKAAILSVMATPVESKGEARLAETALINALAATGVVKLHSVADGRRKSNALVK